jgi:hypothetical protein
MTRRTVTLLAALLLALALLAAPAAARNDAWGPMGPHPHALLLHVQAEPNPAYPTAGPPFIVTGFARCVDLAGGKPLPGSNHHTTVHQGTAGGKLFAAGHLVAPYDCATISALIAAG